MITGSCGCRDLASGPGANKPELLTLGLSSVAERGEAAGYVTTSKSGVFVTYRI